LSQISITANTHIDSNIGIMGESVYVDDPLVSRIKEIFISNDLALPSNNSIIKTDNRIIKLAASEFNELSMEINSKFICYRNAFTHKKISTELFDCIREIHYLIGLYNMINTIGYINHSLNWDKRNLLLQDCARSMLWERNNSFVTKILKRCLEKINRMDYKAAVELFFEKGANNDYYFGEMFKIVNIPHLSSKLLIKFGFLKIDENDKEIYLIPDYLVKSLFDEDNLVLMDNASSYSLYSEENLNESLTGKILKYSYMPYYSDGIHLLYGFKR